MSSVRSAGRSGIFLRMRLRRGLVQGEVLVLVAMLAILGMLTLVALGDGRRAARLGQCQANLRFYGAMTASYGADSSDLAWGFSWTIGQTGNPFGHAATTLQAHSDQAVTIMNNRGPFSMAPITGWIPNVLFSHLPLHDYTASLLPAIEAVCPSDVHPFRWNRDPLRFRDGGFTPRPYSGSWPSNNDLRWAFYSTYTPGIAHFDRAADPSKRLKYGPAYNSFFIPSGADIGQTRLTDVVYPSSKVLMHESHSFHHGTRQAYHDYPEARINLVMQDGSVANRSTSDANGGWDPHNPTAPSSNVQYTYAWSASAAMRWYPGPLNGTLSDNVNGYYRWTRGGLAGRDFDGPPARTGQP